MLDVKLGAEELFALGALMEVYQCGEEFSNALNELSIIPFEFGVENPDLSAQLLDVIKEIAEGEHGEEAQQCLLLGINSIVRH